MTTFTRDLVTGSLPALVSQGAGSQQTCSQYEGQPPSCPAPQLLSMSPSFRYFRTQGVDTPGYHKKLRGGELLPFTSFRQTEVTLDAEGFDSTYHVKYAYPWGVLHRFSNLAVPGYTLLGSVSSSGMLINFPKPTLVDNREILLKSALAKLYTSGFDAGTFLAEFGKTVDLFTGISTRMRKLFTKGKRTLSLEESWLEYRYGWRLLVYDIKDLHDLVSSIADPDPSFRTQRVGMSTGDVITSDHVTGACPTSWVNVPHLQATRYSLNERVSVVTKTSIPKLLFDPFVTAWEEIPYSFVIDWFFNIGEWIASQRMLFATRELSLGYGYLETYEVHCLYDASPVDTTPWVYVSGRYRDNFSYSYRATYREPLDTTVSLPDFRLKFDLSKMVDLLALMRTFIFRKVRFGR